MSLWRTSVAVLPPDALWITQCMQLEHLRMVLTDNNLNCEVCTMFANAFVFMLLTAAFFCKLKLSWVTIAWRPGKVLRFWKGIQNFYRMTPLQRKWLVRYVLWSGVRLFTTSRCSTETAEWIDHRCYPRLCCNFFRLYPKISILPSVTSSSSLNFADSSAVFATACGPSRMSSA